MKQNPMQGIGTRHRQGLFCFRCKTLAPPVQLKWSADPLLRDVCWWTRFSFFFLLKKLFPLTAAVTLQLPSVTLQLPSVTLQRHWLHLCSVHLILRPLLVALQVSSIVCLNKELAAGRPEFFA